MEQRIVRTDIQNCQSIYDLPNHYLFSGNHIRSCPKQGGTLVEYPGVRHYLTAIESLPESNLIAEDCNGVYHILNLELGCVLASRKMPRGIISTRRFAITDDGKSAFRIWLQGSRYYLAIIDVSDLSYFVCPYPASLSCVSDLVYSSGKGLLVLESQVNGDRMCQNQVTAVSIEGNVCRTAPLYTWSGGSSAKFFDGRFVWESGYRIRDLHKGESFYLLENTEIPLPESIPMDHTYYPEKYCLQIVDRTQNIFIDCDKRKIIAHYMTDSLAGSYKGVLTGDEFWIGKTDGIYAVPFPAVMSL